MYMVLYILSRYLMIVITMQLVLLQK